MLSKTDSVQEEALKKKSFRFSQELNSVTVNRLSIQRLQSQGRVAPGTRQGPDDKEKQ